MAETEKVKRGLLGCPGLAPPAPGRCRFGTLNCQGITGKVSEIIDLFNANHLNILGLQEVRMRPENIAALRRAVEKAGLKLYIDAKDCATNAQGQAAHGVAIIANHPLALDRNPLKKRYPGRSLFARVHVPRRRPLRLGIPYHDATSAANAEDQAGAMMKHLLEMGDAAVAMGDWNRVKEEPPFATALAHNSLI